MLPEFNALSGATGLEIVDPIETRRFTLHTPDGVSPESADESEFSFPVDSACRIRTDALTIQYAIPVDVRTPGATHLASIDPPADTTYPVGEYLLDLHAPIKVYLRFASEFRIESDASSTRIEFDGAVPVAVGARSHHSSPAGTVTVPDDPEALMRAVSAFPSALKTTSPERSWPTMRGHPPKIECGDELSIPDGLDAAETAATVRVPTDYGSIYTVAPFAYYLGATVVPGESARLITESGIDRGLGDGRTELAEKTERLLKRIFLLDCVTRTEGYYPDDLHEREVLESRLDLDFAALYDAPVADRLEAYLSVPEDALADVLPTWHRITHVESDPGFETAELLPSVVNDLSLVRVKETSDEPWTPTDGQRRIEEAVHRFVRAPTDISGDGFVRSGAPQSRGVRGIDRNLSTRGVPGVGGYMPLPDVDALEQAWIGDETPIEGTKLLPEAFTNETPTSYDGTIDITVVCNDEEMREEWETVSEIYSGRDDVRVEADCRFDAETGELRRLLADETDLFHFIGHIDGQGFKCPDGILDAGTLERTGATTVLLNGCRSHDQGIAMVEAGANAAVVSLADLWNAGAVEVGETLARLFHHGFSVGHAMKIVREHTSLGNHYVVVGDPGVTVAQCENGVPTMYHIDTNSGRSTGSNEVVAEPHAYPVRSFSIGSIFQAYLPRDDRYYLASGTGYKTPVGIDALRGLFTNPPDPLVIDGELTWGDTWLKEE